VTPVSLSSWVFINWGVRGGNTSPQLLLVEDNGKNGIPNYVVACYTNNPTKLTFKWGIMNLSNTIIDSTPQTAHVYSLENLLPLTEYWYQVSNNNSVLKFKTPSNATNYLKIAVAGDPHIGGLTSNKTATSKILSHIVDPSRKINMFLSPGDIVDYGFSDTEWVKAVNFISATSSIVPIRTTPGNHDAMFGGDKFYMDYFYPTGAPLINGTQFYQRIDFNQIHFLVLDLEWGTERYFGEQEVWLKQQLASIDPNDWTIVMSHTFYYASGTIAAGTFWKDNPETIKTLVPLFEQYDVDMVFSGHIHAMEHLIQNNISYSVIGAAGGKLEPPKTDNSTARSNFYSRDIFGYLEVEFQGDYANLTYYDTEAQSLFTYIHKK
jgi:UDP-2,3-diacylglucosamine pyrophosphatase LpxH